MNSHSASLVTMAQLQCARDDILSDAEAIDYIWAVLSVLDISSDRAIRIIRDIIKQTMQIKYK